MKIWKKIVCVALALALSLSLFACGGGKSKVTLNVLNWGDYIDPQLLRQFEDETGIAVSEMSVVRRLSRNMKRITDTRIAPSRSAS